MDRYDRNRLVDFVGDEGQEKLKDAKVLVLGAGGVGSFVLMNLSALGIGHIGIVDSDKVDISNLNRQLIYNMNSIGKYKVDEAKKWINNLNPDIDVKTYCVRLDRQNCEEIYNQYDILVDAFDTEESVEIINETSVKYNKILIHAGLCNTQGSVMTTIPYKTACVNCFIETKKRIKEERKPKGAIAPSVSIIASLEVYEVLKIILGKGNLIVNSPLIVECTHGKMLRPKIYYKEEKCPVCGLPLCDFIENK